MRLLCSPWSELQLCRRVEPCRAAPILQVGRLRIPRNRPTPRKRQAPQERPSERTQPQGTPGIQGHPQFPQQFTRPVVQLVTREDSRVPNRLGNQWATQ